MKIFLISLVSLLSTLPCFGQTSIVNGQNKFSYTLASVVVGTGTAFMLDDFDAGTTLETRTPNLGDAWGSGFQNSDFTITGGALSDETLARRCGNPTVPASADYTVVVRCRTGGSTSGDHCGVVMRLSADNNNYYLIVQQGGGNWFGTASVAGVEDDFASGTTPSFSASTDYDFKLIASGTNLKGYRDSTQLFDVTLTSVAAAGSPGVVMRNTSARAAFIYAYNP